MQPLVSAAEMRAAEQAATEHGMTVGKLMELAGNGAAQELLARPGGDRRRYLVLAGPGNNGGDALIVARVLRGAGAPVQLITYRRHSPAPDAPPIPEGIPHFAMEDDKDGARLHDALSASDLVVDGLLGTGRTRPPEPDLAAMLRAVASAPGRPRVIALDLPTGVNPDTGAADEATLAADETFTFGYVKRGLLLYPARTYCGALRLIDIGLPPRPEVPVAAWIPDRADIAGWLPPREPTVQKYSAGSVLALAGSPHYVGAPILCTMAAMRAGAGYCTLATTEDALPSIAPRLLEVTLAPLPSHEDEGPGPDALPRLERIGGRYHALLLGPGLGRAPRVAGLVLSLLEGALNGPRAAVVDADALYALAGTAEWPSRLALPVVLTPHTGEMARLTGLPAEAIEADRFGTAAAWAERWGQVVVLKGAPTIVAEPGGRLMLNATGNRLLATAGTGDVLSGVIAAFLAGDTPSFEAACAGVYVHGLAADLALPTYGDRGMLAGDLLPLLPQAIRYLLQPEAPAPRQS